jgi:hypothetical protein
MIGDDFFSYGVSRDLPGELASPAALHIRISCRRNITVMIVIYLFLWSIRAISDNCSKYLSVILLTCICQGVHGSPKSIERRLRDDLKNYSRRVVISFGQSEDGELYYWILGMTSSITASVPDQIITLTSLALRIIIRHCFIYSARTGRIDTIRVIFLGLERNNLVGGPPASCSFQIVTPFSECKI